MNVITLICQLDFAQACLLKMKAAGRPEKEINLQTAIVETLENRIREKGPI